jgi:hypothetical protein
VFMSRKYRDAWPNFRDDVTIYFLRSITLTLHLFVSNSWCNRNH